MLVTNTELIDDVVVDELIELLMTVVVSLLAPMQLTIKKEARIGNIKRLLTFSSNKLIKR